MDYCFGVAVKGQELYDVGFSAGVYVYNCTYIPRLQTFLANVVSQDDSVVFLVNHVHSHTSD